MKIKEENLTDEFELEDLEEDFDQEFEEEWEEEWEEEEEAEQHRKISLILHLMMITGAIVIAVIFACVYIMRSNPIVYNDVDATGIEVSGVYQTIIERDNEDFAENYVENKVSITTLTEDSDVPAVLLEGVLSELHGMQVCFSEDTERRYYAACFTSGNTTYLLESEEINKKQFSKAVEQFIEDQY